MRIIEFVLVLPIVLVMLFAAVVVCLAVDWVEVANGNLEG